MKGFNRGLRSNIQNEEQMQAYQDHVNIQKDVYGKIQSEGIDRGAITAVTAQQQKVMKL